MTPSTRPRIVRTRTLCRIRAACRWAPTVLIAILVRLLLDHRPGMSIWPIGIVVAGLLVAGIWNAARRRNPERMPMATHASRAGLLPMCVAPMGWTDLRLHAPRALVAHLALLLAFVLLPVSALAACALGCALWAAMRCRRCTVRHDECAVPFIRSPRT